MRLTAMKRATLAETRHVRVLVLGNVRLFREGIALVVGAHDGLHLVGSAALDANLERLVREERPDVALLDAAAIRDGAVIQSLLTVDASLRVVAYGIVDEELDAVRCAEAGAAGYISREANADDLVTTILAVARGEFQCSARVTSLMFRRMATLVSESRALGPAMSLSARERQIATFINRGCANKEIATALGVEVSTVKNHVHHILEKLGVARRGQVAARVRHEADASPSIDRGRV
jgi:DNA-binding NarL/FixJ family response regulator